MSHVIRDNDASLSFLRSFTPSREAIHFCLVCLLSQSSVHSQNSRWLFTGMGRTLSGRIFNVQTEWVCLPSLFPLPPPFPVGGNFIPYLENALRARCSGSTFDTSHSLPPILPNRGGKTTKVNTKIFIPFYALLVPNGCVAITCIFFV